MCCYLGQRFVSSTGNIEVLLSHTHSIVCDNDLEGLFLGCLKSRQMAAHDLNTDICTFTKIGILSPHFSAFSSAFLKLLYQWVSFDIGLIRVRASPEYRVMEG